MGTELPLESWILIMVAVGLGLGIELAFLRAQRGRGQRPGADRADPERSGEGW